MEAWEQEMLLVMENTTSADGQEEEMKIMPQRWIKHGNFVCENKIKGSVKDG